MLRACHGPDSVHLYADFAREWTLTDGGKLPRWTRTTPVDPKRVDLETYPLVAQSTLHVARLSAGDVLYLPDAWWHMVAVPPSPPGMRQQALSVQFRHQGNHCGPHPCLFEGDMAFSAQRIEASLQRRRGPPPPPPHERDAERGAATAEQGPSTLLELKRFAQELGRPSGPGESWLNGEG